MGLGRYGVWLGVCLISMNDLFGESGYMISLNRHFPALINHLTKRFIPTYIKSTKLLNDVCDKFSEILHLLGDGQTKA